MEKTMPETLRPFLKNGQTHGQNGKIAVLERLRNGETAAQISKETGIDASTIRGWAYKERARIEVENAGKNNFLHENGQTHPQRSTENGAVGTFHKTDEDLAAIVSAVSVNRSAASSPSVTFPAAVSPVFETAGKTQNGSSAAEQNGNAKRKTFAETFSEKYIGNEPVLALVQFVCIGFAIRSAWLSGNDTALMLSIVCGLVILDCMEVIRVEGLHKGHTMRQNLWVFYVIEAGFFFLNYYSGARHYGVSNVLDFEGHGSDLAFCAIVSLINCVLAFWSFGQTMAKTREVQR